MVAVPCMLLRRGAKRDEFSNTHVLGFHANDFNLPQIIPTMPPTMWAVLAMEMPRLKINSGLMRPYTNEPKL